MYLNYVTVHYGKSLTCFNLKWDEMDRFAQAQRLLWQQIVT